MCAKGTFYLVCYEEEFTFKNVNTGAIPLVSIVGLLSACKEHPYVRPGEKESNPAVLQLGNLAVGHVASTEVGRKH